MAEETDSQTPTERPTRLPASAGYAVGLPDTQGGMCWLAGYESDPTRYYTPSCALIFKTRVHAVAAIVRARKTHPGREREYRVIPASEMARHNVSGEMPLEANKNL